MYTPFKTPNPVRTPSGSSDGGATTNSDSDGSTGSNELSLLAEFDDMMRMVHFLKGDKKANDELMINFLEKIKLIVKQYTDASSECKRLQKLTEEQDQDLKDLERNLSKARRLLDLERNSTRNAQKRSEELLMQLDRVREVILKEQRERLPEETRHKLSFLTEQGDWGAVKPHLSAIQEVNSTGSLLSDFSYSRSEDDLEVSLSQKSWKKHQASQEGVVEPPQKKRRSSGRRSVEITASETVRATTTLTLNKRGPITATSVIESVPKGINNNLEIPPSAPPASLVFESWNRESPRKRGPPIRPHSFYNRTHVMPEVCCACQKRIGFAKAALKCKDCRAICHIECKEVLPVPCIPANGTPNQRTQLVLSEYAPTTPPMVPGILIHCINEIELRGLNEIGLYRISGSERDVKALKERFLKGRGAPNLNEIEVHVICGVVKDFLRSLNEPLVTYQLCKEFVHAIQTPDHTDIVPSFYQIISQLPHANRDTLAYVVLHLQKISESPECKMSKSNLGKIFGPTIVGDSTHDLDEAACFNKMMQHNMVMDQFLNIPSEYWTNFIDVQPSLQSTPIQSTPSTDSLFRTYGLKTPNKSLLKRKQKYFPSPKH